MPRKYRYKDVYLDQQITALLQELLPDPRIKRLLILHNLDQNVQGVAKLAIIFFLKDIDKQLAPNKPPNNTNAPKP